MPVYGVERPRQLGWQGVFRIRPGARPGEEPQLLVDRFTFSQPNGLCFSPDESLLYVNDTDQANIRVYEVAADGSLTERPDLRLRPARRLEPGVPDGMKCDAEGNVWCTAPGGLWVYAPNGRLIGKVAVPELAANSPGAAPDWRTLYVCATTSVYAIPVKVGPRGEPFMQGAAGARNGPRAARRRCGSTRRAAR